MSSERSRGARRCPVCGGPVAARPENPAFPFCRVRCREIDLGAWFSGGYVISRPLSPDAEPGPEPTDDPADGGDDRDM